MKNKKKQHCDREKEKEREENKGTKKEEDGEREREREKHRRMKREMETEREGRKGKRVGQEGRLRASHAQAVRKVFGRRSGGFPAPPLPLPEAPTQRCQGSPF